MHQPRYSPCVYHILLLLPQYNDHIVSQYPTGLQSYLSSRLHWGALLFSPHRIGMCIFSVLGHCSLATHSPSFQEYPKSKDYLGTIQKVPSTWADSRIMSAIYKMELYTMTEVCTAQWMHLVQEREIIWIMMLLTLTSQVVLAVIVLFTYSWCRNQ